MKERALEVIDSMATAPLLKCRNSAYMHCLHFLVAEADVYLSWLWE